MASDRQTSLKLLATGSTGRAVSSASSFDESDIALPVGSPAWTILSVTLFVTYIILMSAMPFYNKVLFQIYTKPITATLIQLFGVIIFLFFYCIFMKKYEIYQSKKMKKSPYNDNNDNNNIENNNTRKHSHSHSHSHHSHNHNHNHNHHHNSHHHSHDHGGYHNTHKNNDNNDNNNDNFVITNSNSINNNNNSGVVLSPANDSRISNTSQRNDGDSLIEIMKELLFYNNLKMRLYYLILPSFFFSGSILLTNIGIDLASVDISTLLRTSEIIWFVILTPIITKKDFPTWIAIIAAIIVMIGTFLFSFSVLKTHDVTPIALIINIASSVFTPFQIVYLKRATNVLCDVSSIEREEYGIRVMKSYEITFIKLFLSLIFIIPCALIVEQFEAWRALTEGFQFECNILVVLFGVIMTCLFQWNTVSLTNYVEPVLIGVGSQLKTIFSYLGSLIVSGVVLYVCNCINKDENESNDCKSSDNKYPDCPCFDNAKNEFSGQFGTIHIIGVILIVVGMISYTFIKYKNKHITNVSCWKQCRLF